MQAEFRPGNISIDETRVGIVSRKSGFGRSARCDNEKGVGHARPMNSGVRVHRIIAVSSSVRYPADTAAVCHCDRHRVTARHDQVTEWGELRNPFYFLNQYRRFGSSDAAEQEGAFFKFLDFHSRVFESPSFKNARSGGYVFSGASICGTCPIPGMRYNFAFPFGIVSATNFIRSLKIEADPGRLSSAPPKTSVGALMCAQSSTTGSR